jgi:amino acid adenylation domain-containing protein
VKGISTNLAALSPEKRALLEAMLKKKGVAAPEGISRRADGGPAPLSFQQERLWYLDQLEPGRAAYNIPVTQLLTGALDVDALRRALTEVVRRHESLRTVFSARDGAPVQVALPPAAVPLPVDDLADVPAEVRDGAVERWVHTQAAGPIDLAAGPPFRAGLLRLDAERHVLAMTLHHVVGDGWSLGVLFRETAVLYAAFTAGRPSPLPPLDIQYADYAAWQRARLAGDALDQQLAWWRERLEGAPAVLELPTDHLRAAAPSGRGGRERHHFDAALLAELRAVARAENATLFHVLLAAFALLLGRYAGQQDVLVGSPVAGRAHRETEALIGFFVNTLVLRTDLSGDPTFRELVGRVRDATLAAHAHPDLPFERLVEELRPERSRAHTPLFQVMFVLQNSLGSRTEMPGLTVQAVEKGAPEAKFDLTLSMVEGGTGLAATVDYAADLFDPETVRRMIASLGVLLRAAAADPGRRLSALPVLAEEEAERVLRVWNGDAAAFPTEPVHVLFARQAARTPDADAVVAADGTLTYAQLDARANRLAHRLRALGVGVESRVGLCFDRSVHAMVGVMGILKAGGAYVPLDPGLPRERMAHVAADSALRATVTLDRLAQLLPDEAGEVIRVDVDGSDAFPAEDPGIDVPGDALAYVIYTSGSTGTPKGVMVPHAGVANLTHGFVPAHPFLSHHRVLVIPPISFDASVGDLFPVLAIGAALVFHPRPAELNARELRRFCAEHAVNVIDAPAALWKAWVDEVVPEGADALPPGLEMVMMGGESVDVERVRAWEALTGGRVQLVNHYGPTEATVAASVERAFGEETWTRPVNLPIGRPLPNVRCYVVDGGLRPVPQGAHAELAIGGAGVTRGYQNRPGQTAAAFVPDPFSAVPGARMYLTGDRVRWLADGRLEFLGRADHQVKVRGYRIELGDVEAALRQLPAVRDCAVAVREDVPGSARLVAYMVPAHEGVGGAELRQSLRGALPDYMIPTAWVMMDALPLTPNGKVDRRALPAPEPGRAADTPYVAPRDEVEAAIAAAWEELLHASPVGVTDDFFELGGSSLLSVRLVDRVEQRLGVRVPLGTLVSGGTVEAMANAARALLRDGADEGPLVALRAEGMRPPLFCVHPTEGAATSYLHLARHLSADQPVYGLEDPAVRGGGEMLGMEEMASVYVRAVRQKQPEGPYHLLGWSFGGFVAYEMARQLRAAGHHVAALLLLDTPCPLYLGDFVEDEAERLSAVANNLAVFNGRAITLTAGDLRGLADDQGWAHASALLADAGVNAKPQWLRRVVTVGVGRGRALHAWGPGPYDGEITLLRAAEVNPAALDPGHEQYEAMRDPALGWGRLASRPVAVYTVPGNHATLVTEPHVLEVARVVTHVLGD